MKNARNKYEYIIVEVHKNLCAKLSNSPTDFLIFIIGILQLYELLVKQYNFMKLGNWYANVYLQNNFFVFKIFKYDT